MTWVLLDDNFNNHPKAVQAGPVACWLYCCGLMYCRKHHTDGFIPKRAVGTLGVTTNTKRLEAALVDVGLWETAEGGYRVHDYHAIYESDAALKADKEARREQKRAAGRIGGLTSWQNRSTSRIPAEAEPPPDAEAEPKQTTSRTEAHVLKPIRVGTGSDPGLGIGSSERGLGKTMQPPPADVPMDVWFRDLQAAYPPSAVSSGHLTEQAFIAAVLSQGSPLATFAVMEANLASQKRGHQWRVKGMIPRLDRWLRDGLWKQQHEEHPVSTLVSDKTARTLSSGDAFVRGQG